MSSADFAGARRSYEQLQPEHAAAEASERSVEVIAVAAAADGLTAAATAATHPWVLDPNSRFRQSWDIVQAFLLIYVGVVCPYRVAFGVEVVVFSFIFWIELSMDLYFIVDFCLSFRTGYVDTDSRELVMEPRRIAWRYLTGWFTIDLISSFPIGYIVMIYNASHPDTAADGSGGGFNQASSRMTRMLRALRLAKLLRLARFSQLLERYQDSEIYEYLMGAKVPFVVGLILFLSHLCTCIWYAVGTESDGWGREDD